MSLLKHHARQGLTLLLLLPALVTADSREPVGAVLDASSSVSTQTDGKPARLELFDYLFDQQKIKVPAGASLVVSLRANRTDYVIKGPASLTVQADGLRFDSGKAASSKTRPDVAVSALLAGPRTQGAVRLRGPRGLLPTPGTVVSTTSPVLSWPALSGTDSYELILSDGSGNLESRISVEGTHWQPAAAQALTWGHAYRWRVQPAEGDNPGVSGSFTVISEADHDQLTQLAPGSGASFAERVVYAKALDHLGVRDDARMLWQALAEERPDSQALQGYLKVSP
ncbi:MAG: hypothetical protein VW625_01275 [Perlucidibaca sp.]